MKMIMSRNDLFKTIEMDYLKQMRLNFSCYL